MISVPSRGAAKPSKIIGGSTKSPISCTKWIGPVCGGRRRSEHVGRPSLEGPTLVSRGDVRFFCLNNLKVERNLKRQDSALLPQGVEDG